jgi:hypothetical protein
MQSTGLPDKNGVEIYEGDIVKVETRGGVVYGDVKYKSCSFMIYSEDMDRIMLDCWDYEVIGNIYENANLTELNKYKRMQRRTKMFMNLPSREVVERLREEYPEGTRVRLISMQDPYAPPRGTEGTVQGVDDAGAIMVDWDNGSGLHILYEVDVCKKI